MAKYRVKTSFTRTYTYEAIIEALNETDASNEARKIDGDTDGVICEDYDSPLDVLHVTELENVVTIQRLIEWNESKEVEMQTFGVIPKGVEYPELLEEDDQVFYWLSQYEAKVFGNGFTNGEWVVL